MNRLRSSLHYRREAFDAGLQACGLQLRPEVNDPRPGDMLVIWNRYAGQADEAHHFERAGAKVLVVENGWLGKAWRGGEWFTLTQGHAGGAGSWINRGGSRWSSWSVDLGDWRGDDGETVVLEQRGIGEDGVASPAGWAERARRLTGGRIRPHPASGRTKLALDADLAAASRVVTWNSAAAMQALILGVPVWYDAPHWLGATAARPMAEWGAEPVRDDDARLYTLSRAAWTLWSLDEVRAGDAIASVLGSAT